jgi:membrane-bound ClpP family serine protease
MTTAPAAPAEKLGFQFTIAGCRTELRLGALLVLAGTFLWLFLGPIWCTRLILVGLPLLYVGTVFQALEARRGQPGYPLLLGVCMVILGAAMWYDLRYREAPGLPVQVMPVGPYLVAAGGWLLLWSPLAFLGRRQAASA